MTVLDIAACQFRLGRTENIDALIEKAMHVYFDAYENIDIEIEDYAKEMREMIDYFTKEYHDKQLDQYKPLDLKEIEKRIGEKD